MKMLSKHFTSLGAKIINLSLIFGKMRYNDIIILSLLIKLSGWITLFIVNWQVGVAMFVILFAQLIQQNLFIGTLNRTLNNMLITLKNLSGKQPSSPSNGENSELKKDKEC